MTRIKASTARVTAGRAIRMSGELRLGEHLVPSKVNPLGAKGVGESGCTASLPTLGNATMDALRPLGIQDLDMPVTPNKVWHAIQAVKGDKGR